MAARSDLTAITTQGGLLPAELLARLAQQPDALSGTGSDDYHLPTGRRLRDAINRSWTDLQGAWAAYQTELAHLPVGDRATTVTRERWLLPLFAELGYGRLPHATDYAINGRTYPISHGWGPVPIHLLGADIDLGALAESDGFGLVECNLDFGFVAAQPVLAPDRRDVEQRDQFVDPFGEQV